MLNNGSIIEDGELSRIKRTLSLAAKKLTSSLRMSTKYAKMLTYQPEMSTK